MKIELKHVDPLRLANVSAVVYAVMMLAFSLLLLPLFLLLMVLQHRGADARDFFSAVVPLVFLILYPILGLILGWLGGALAAGVYNLVSRWTGGLLLEFSEREEQAVSPVDLQGPPRPAS